LKTTRRRKRTMCTTTEITTFTVYDAEAEVKARLGQIALVN